ncbi:hypothetical+protein [Methylocapsa aurea]
MLIVETIGRIRREHFVKGKTIKEIARDLGISRNTVRKALRSEATSFAYERDNQPFPKLGPWSDKLDEVLAENEKKAPRERLTLIRIFEDLSGLGYAGGYDAVRRYSRKWRSEQGAATAAAYVPLSFEPGEAYQFDWSHEIVVLDGVTTTVKVAHMRLCHSRMPFVRAYPRETQEMVFDAHDRAFTFFRGACTRGIYDNMKTAVETIFVGKERKFNRRFAQMCSHHLVEPVACTPASGWEKGQVENQVGLARERFFTPRLRFKTYDDMNAWLLDKCVTYAKAHPHPEIADKTVWEAFEEERPKLVPLRGRFDGFHELTASVSKTCLVRFDNNKYSVNASAVGARSRSTPTPTASSSAKKGGWSPNMLGPSGAARRSSIPGIMCQFSRASPARYGTARRSRTGCCRERSSACGVSSPAAMMGIDRWSRFWPPSSRTD